MFKLPNGANGKATDTKAPDTFFQQYAPVPNPIDPRQITLVPLPGTGIPMRDYFAAKIAAGFASQSDFDMDTLPDSKYQAAIASDAYRLADAMLKARTERNDSVPPSQFHEDYLK